MKTFLLVNFRIPGFHRWRNSPEKYKYLSNIHRHEFHICCEIEVCKNRQFEVIALKDTIRTMLLDKLGTHRFAAVTLMNMGLPLVTDSCILLDENTINETSVEGLADFIATYIRDEISNYGKICVTVLEDGENGARIETKRRW